MLQSLTINNIALITHQTIELDAGFNVLTGETGAGKSLIIDSLALLLGEKADKTLISYGANFASVEAVFETSSEHILSKMEELGLERENTIVIFRKLSLDGRNECRVNGKTFSLSMLKSLTAPLMDLHGQFQHQEILKESHQLKTLDGFGGEKIKVARETFAENYRELKRVKKQLSEFNFDSREREKLLDLYQYQINEIEEANFADGEEEELKDFRTKVINQEKIALSLSRLTSCFDGDENGAGLLSLIKKCDYELGEIVRYLPEKQELASQLNSARFDLEDIAESINQIQGELDFDEFSAQENERRLDTLTSLKKKYGSSIPEINEYLAKIKVEYEKLLGSAEIIEKLESQREILTQKLIESAKSLSSLRKEVAEEFKTCIKNELAELSMKGAGFDIVFKTTDENTCDETGFDKIEFIFTANSGQPLRPLSKVASGGEMSRFMLAVKNITADIDNVDTMIFDEIDTGISGDTANVLAKKLAKIGKKHQVVCVTHLAGVASYGTSHFYISKSEQDGKTKTSVEKLDDSTRIREIARLLGGNISDFSLNHAKLMLDAGKNL